LNPELKNGPASAGPDSDPKKRQKDLKVDKAIAPTVRYNIEKELFHISGKVSGT